MIYQAAKRLVGPCQRDIPIENKKRSIPFVTMP
jgi:hypothetical protein